MIDPEIVKSLQQVPDFQALIGFLKEEALKLNRLDNIIAGGMPEQIALETMSRQYAYKTVLGIIEPLLSSEESPSIKVKNEYNVLPDDKGPTPT